MNLNKINLILNLIQLHLNKNILALPTAGQSNFNKISWSVLYMQLDLNKNLFISCSRK